jgi:PAS domain S-box-containing protein
LLFSHILNTEKGPSILKGVLHSTFECYDQYYPFWRKRRLASPGKLISWRFPFTISLLKNLRSAGDFLMNMSSSQSNHNSYDNTLAGGGEMGRLMRAQNWQDSSFGPKEYWPQSLRTAVSICLASRFPIILFWGQELRQFYNDAYRPILGQTKHPDALGQRAQDCWPEVWDVIGPMLHGVLITGEATWSENQLLLLDRNGYVEECYFTFSYSPIRNETGEVGGIFCAVTETTAEILDERRLHTLRSLAITMAQARTVEQVCQITVSTLIEHSADLPFSLLYLLNNTNAQLAGTTGLPAGTLASPDTIVLSDPESPWPLSQVAFQGEPELLDDLTSRFTDSWKTLFQQEQPLPHSALLLPIPRVGETHPYAILIVGINPRRHLDADYSGFLTLLAGQIAAAIGATLAYQEAQQRVEALAELNRTKTAFFSNISHEFRTPLTLLLGPLDTVLADPHNSLDSTYRTQLEMVRRNGLRQLKLVNALLDFSRLEAGRMEAFYTPTDLSSLTLDLASAFRSAIEGAGIQFIVECSPLAEPVYIDRDMWEKIVLNLLSNAFKFTLEGQISVTLQEVNHEIQLSIADTGIGIAQEDLPHLFERFYQAHSSRSHTQEGSGIGLSLVQELVHLHDGNIELSSTPGKGTIFTVHIPYGGNHLPKKQIQVMSNPATNALSTASYLAEAHHWIHTDQEQHVETFPQQDTALHQAPERARILIIDDNTDMRDYLKHLLSPFYTLQSAIDGHSALALINNWLPDLILSDVMMPGMDGFALLSALRTDPRLRSIPIILLSARAGEEATIEGLQAGADDYLVKPFSANELLARINARMEIASLRREISLSEERFRSAFAHSRVGMAYTDLTGRFLQVNSAYVNIVGYPEEELLQTDFFSLTHPDDRDPKRILIQELLKGNIPGYFIEKRYIRKDTCIVWVRNSVSLVHDTMGQPQNIIILTEDITKRKQAEEESKRAQQHLQDLFMKAPAMICITHGPEHRLELINDPFRQLYGNREVFLGKTARENWPELADQGFFERLDQVYQTGVPFVGQEVPAMIDRTGTDTLEQGYFNMVYQPSRNVEGQVDSILVHIMEVTEQVLARQRMDTFLGIASHELRSPMTAIKANVQLARRRLKRITEEFSSKNKNLSSQLAETQSMLERAERQIGFQNRLVNDLIDTTRIQAQELELRLTTADLGQIVSAVIEEQRQLAPTRSISLTLPQDTSLSLLIDTDRIGQVVTNYLTNALKYSDEEKPVSVAVARLEKQIRVAVRDEGPGLSFEQQKNLWQRFYRVPGISVKSGSGVGLGLGLHICRTIIEQHGGQVGVESTPGEGSTFWFTLPLPN